MPSGLSLADFDAVLFDVDGTLVDSLGMLIPGLSDSIEKYAGQRPTDEEIQSLIGMPLREQAKRYISNPTEDEIDRFSNYTISRYEAYKDRERIFGPAVEMLRLCKRSGLRTALVTSKNAKELALFINRFPAADAVDETVCASEVHHPKPAPDSAILALKKLGATPDRAVFIGDSVYDLRCAKAAGVATVAVGYGAATPNALLAESPDLFLDRPEDLLAWAEGSFQEDNAPQESTIRQLIDDTDRTAGAA